MPKVWATACLLGFICLITTTSYTRQTGRIQVEQARQWWVVLEGEDYVNYLVDDVIIQTDSGRIYCDSAVWRPGDNVRLIGQVILDNPDNRLTADSVFYNLITSEADAYGSNVEIWSYRDSLYAAGLHAYFDNRNDFFHMDDRPILYLNYPDSARMVEVIADRIEYDAPADRAEANGSVIITSQDMTSYSDCAIMNTADNSLDLFGNPRATRGNSEVTGEFIMVAFRDDLLDRIDVFDSAQGEFSEPIDSAETGFDRSVLKGDRITLDMRQGKLDNVLCYGQAYSWYYPSTRGSNEFHENSVSGDTIRFTVDGERLIKVDVIDGAIGTFVSGQLTGDDTLTPPVIDTVDYSSRFIRYNLVDSVISLREASHVESGSVALDAQEILFDTRRRVIEAFSADIDSIFADSTDTTVRPGSDSANLLPNAIPVILKDGNDELYGDYLEYSIDTEKGRIVQSKSDYEAGFYYGRKLFREQKHIFYIDGGRYTTCDEGEPHYHFHSSSMKLIEGEKLIAKPVVFYIGRLPIMVIPYYVFPLKKGRHSGFLPFSFGRFEKGDRYVRDVGYYWAASEYWDWQGSFDYHEENRDFTVNNRATFRKRYVLDGSVSSRYTRNIHYNPSVAAENKSRRYVVNATYQHTISPSFNISAGGSYQSDADYYTDYSSNMEERLNRVVSSRLNFSKKFGANAAVSGNIKHDVDLDRESRTDYLPSMSISLPTLFPFGSGRLNDEGRLEQKWFQNTQIRYNPSLVNYSRRVMKDSTYITYDTTITDSVLVDTTEHQVDYRSRIKYAKINHNPRLSLPTIKLAKYFLLTPNINYAETWFKIFETDQSRDAEIDASKTYRTYSYSGGAGFKTALYGTVYPNIFGLTGLRHVISPTVSYSFSPDIDRHPEVRSFAGGGAGSSKSSRMALSVNQLFQGKARQGEQEKNLQLLSITSGFSHDFENFDRPFSNLGTSFSISTLPKITLSGNMTHSFYKPETDELDFWSPYLMGFSLNTSFTLTGSRFLFDDFPAVMPQGADSAADVTDSSPAQGRQGWNLQVTYSFQESGREQNYQKNSFVNFSLGFNLTPNTTIAYSQRYDVVKKFTVQNSVNIVRTIHCWTGHLWWVPIGSNRGFGFRLNVTALPEVKVDQNYDTFSSGVLRRR
ncbi:MAG: putative LPS assembly protein LptD [bacterium]